MMMMMMRMMMMMVTMMMVDRDGNKVSLCLFANFLSVRQNN